MDFISIATKMISQIQDKQLEANNQLQRQYQTIEIEPEQIHQISNENMQKDSAINYQSFEINEEKQQNAIDQEQYSGSGFFESIFKKIAIKNCKALEQFMAEFQQIQVEEQNQQIKQQLYTSKSMQIPKYDPNYCIQFYYDTLQQRDGLKKASTEKNLYIQNSPSQLNPANNLNQNPQNQPNSTLQIKKRSISRRKNQPQLLQTKSQSIECNKVIIKQQKADQKSAQQILVQLQQQINRKRSILKTLQKSTQVYNKKSVKVPSRILKMSPQATEQYRQKIKKQSLSKLMDNIQFLDRIKRPQVKQQIKSKQFNNNDPSIKNQLKQQIQTIKLKKSLHKIIYSPATNKKTIKQQIMTEKKSKRQKFNIFSRNSSQRYYYYQNTSQSVNNLHKESRKKQKLPAIQTKSIKKPKPYSIYSVYQKNNQLYLNSPLVRE